VEPKGFTAEEFRHIMRTPFGRLLEDEGIVITDELNVLHPSSWNERQADA
jgi:hypothetical protein